MNIFEEYAGTLKLILVVVLLGALGWGFYATYERGYTAAQLQCAQDKDTAQIKKDSHDASAVAGVAAVRDNKDAADTQDASVDRTIVKWRTRYVYDHQNDASQPAGTVDAEWVRIHDAAALGADPGLLVPERPGDASAAVTDASALEVVTDNYRTYRRVAREREQCRQELATLAEHRLASAAE